MAHRVPERLGDLAGQRPPAQVGDGGGDHDRHVDPGLFARHVDGIERRLAVECVEHGLDQQQVHPALDQGARGLVIGGDEFVEGDVAHAGVVDIGRDRGGAVGRTEDAGDEARPPRARGLDRVRRFTGEARATDVQLMDHLFGTVVGLGDAGRVEGIGLDDVGAGLEIGDVDGGDDLGAAQGQQVVVALLGHGVIGEAGAAIGGLVEPVRLDHGAHGTVQDEDAGVELAHQHVAPRPHVEPRRAPVRWCARHLTRAIALAQQPRGGSCRRLAHARPSAAPAASPAPAAPAGRSPSTWEIA